MEKNPQTRADIFRIFTNFHGDLKSQYANPHENFLNDITKPKMVYLLQ